ncbi:MAG: MarR family winged helix-turn-helix transcriptional regulator [Actinomycetota bacterium]
MNAIRTYPLFAQPDEAAGAGSAPRDIVDEGLEAWKREFPHMDITTEGLVARIHKISRYIDKTLKETAAEFQLTMGDWELLSSLRRQGPPYRLSPSQLSKDLMLSSGAMTNRLDNLEEAGLIVRLPHPEDRRGVIVELTDKGRDTWGEAVDVQAAKEKMFADALTDEEKDLANDLLRKMLLAFQKKGSYPRRAELLEESP